MVDYSYQQIDVQGYLAWDCEIKEGKNGTKYAILKIATNSYKTDKTNETGLVKETEWFKLVTFNEYNIQKLEKYLPLKGDLVRGVGKLKNRTYTGNNGEEKNEIEILCHKIMLLPRPAKSNTESSSNNYMPDNNNSNTKEYNVVENDNIPF